MVVRHGWTLFAHAAFVRQVEKLIEAAERARENDPVHWRENSNVRLLAAIREIVLERVPRDPLAPAFRQGNTLGRDRRHWFRAKFGGNRFRLFFRADSKAKIIVYAWVNDRDTLRKAGSTSDPYVVFGSMLSSGNPPDDWALLLKGAADIGYTDQGKSFALPTIDEGQR